MEKDEIIQKLQDIGITTTNCYPKSSYPRNGDIHVGLFKREMSDDFYFFNNYDKKIYCFLKPDDPEKYETDKFGGNTKYQIPLHECRVVWEDKPFVEKMDGHYKDITLRQYACIHLRVPDSGLDWLDAIIAKSRL